MNAGRVLRAPGAPMLIPLLLGAGIGTATGHTVLGPVTRSLTSATVPLTAVLMLCVGAQVDLRYTRALAGRTVLILTGTTAVPALLILIYVRTFGPNGVAGVPLLTVLAVGMSASYGLWTTLAERYGRARDLPAGALACAISTGPLLPLLVLAAWHRAPDAATGRLLLDAVTPFALGLVLGHLLPSARPALRRTVGPLLPLLAFGLGWAISPHSLLAAAPAGIAVAVLTVAVSGTIVAALRRRSGHRPAALGWAAGACAASAATLPTLLAAADSSLAPFAATATAQACVAVLASTLLATAATALSARRIPAANPAALDLAGRTSVPAPSALTGDIDPYFLCALAPAGVPAHTSGGPRRTVPASNHTGGVA